MAIMVTSSKARRVAYDADDNTDAANLKYSVRHIGKVSTIFEFFASGFVFGLGLALYLVGLYAEFNSALNGTIFDKDRRTKNSLIP